MEEKEVPLEKLHEVLHEEVHKSHNQDDQKWMSHVALTAALFAALAAYAAAMSGHHVNEAMVEQIKSADQWAYFQAKSIKANLLSSKIQILEELKSNGSYSSKAKDQEKLNEYQKEQEAIKEVAGRSREISEKHFHAHEYFSKSVMFFQVAIAISAVAALTRRRPYWYLGITFGILGLYFTFIAL